LHEEKDMRQRLDANGLLDRGAQCAAQRQWTAAIGYMTEAIDLGLEEERLPKALLLRGMCSMREGELSSALGDFTSALNVDSSNETATAAYAEPLGIAYRVASAFDPPLQLIQREESRANDLTAKTSLRTSSTASFLVGLARYDRGHFGSRNTSGRTPQESGGLPDCCLSSPRLFAR
jgi:hypothetical protein